MSHLAALRIGSLEIVVALAIFGILGANLRTGRLGRQRAREFVLQLTVSTPAGTQNDLPLHVCEEAPAVIGRARDAALRLDDPEVSREHARLEVVKGTLFLTDLESRNGTYLNEKPLAGESIEVKRGDDIDVGNTRITIREATAAAWT